MVLLVGQLLKYVVKKRMGEVLEIGEVDAAFNTGFVELHNVRIRRSAVEKADLPVIVTHGVVDRIKVTVLSIASARLLVEVDGICVKCKPRLAAESTASRAPVPGTERRDVGKTESRTAKAESVRAALSSRFKQRLQQFGLPTPRKGKLDELRDAAVRNAEVRVSRIHVQFEDDTNHASPFVVGIVLNRVRWSPCQARWFQPDAAPARPTGDEFEAVAPPFEHHVGVFDDLLCYINSNTIAGLQEDARLAEGSDGRQNGTDEFPPDRAPSRPERDAAGLRRAMAWTGLDFQKLNIVLQPQGGAVKIIRHHGRVLDLHDAAKLKVECHIDGIQVVLETEQFSHLRAVSDYLNRYNQARSDRRAQKDAQLRQRRAGRQLRRDRDEYVKLFKRRFADTPFIVEPSARNLPDDVIVVSATGEMIDSHAPAAASFDSIRVHVPATSGPARLAKADWLRAPDRKWEKSIGRREALFDENEILLYRTMAEFEVMTEYWLRSDVRRRQRAVARAVSDRTGSVSAGAARESSFGGGGHRASSGVQDEASTGQRFTEWWFRYLRFGPSRDVYAESDAASSDSDDDAGDTLRSSPLIANKRGQRESHTQERSRRGSACSSGDQMVHGGPGRLRLSKRERRRLYRAVSELRADELVNLPKGYAIQRLQLHVKEMVAAVVDDSRKPYAEVKLLDINSTVKRLVYGATDVSFLVRAINAVDHLAPNTVKPEDDSSGAAGFSERLHNRLRHVLHFEPCYLDIPSLASGTMAAAGPDVAVRGNLASAASESPEADAHLTGLLRVSGAPSMTEIMRDQELSRYLLEFLKSHHREEAQTLLFWQACELYRLIPYEHRNTAALTIFETYVRGESVELDEAQRKSLSLLARNLGHAVPSGDLFLAPQESVFARLSGVIYESFLRSCWCPQHRTFVQQCHVVRRECRWCVRHKRLRSSCDADVCLGEPWIPPDPPKISIAAGFLQVPDRALDPYADEALDAAEERASILARSRRSKAPATDELDLSDRLTKHRGAADSPTSSDTGWDLPSSASDSPGVVSPTRSDSARSGAGQTRRELSMTARLRALYADAEATVRAGLAHDSDEDLSPSAWVERHSRRPRRSSSIAAVLRSDSSEPTVRAQPTAAHSPVGVAAVDPVPRPVATRLALEGALWKRMPGVRNRWCKRHFVLPPTQHALLYFREAGQEEALGAIPLDQSVRILPGTSSGPKAFAAKAEFERSGFCIVATPRRTVDSRLRTSQRGRPDASASAWPGDRRSGADGKGRISEYALFVYASQETEMRKWYEAIASAIQSNADLERRMSEQLAAAQRGLAVRNAATPIPTDPAVPHLSDSESNSAESGPSSGEEGYGGAAGEVRAMVSALHVARRIRSHIGIRADSAENQAPQLDRAAKTLKSMNAQRWRHEKQRREHDAKVVLRVAVAELTLLGHPNLVERMAEFYSSNEQRLMRHKHHSLATGTTGPEGEVVPDPGREHLIEAPELGAIPSNDGAAESAAADCERHFGAQGAGAALRACAPLDGGAPPNGDGVGEPPLDADNWRSRLRAARGRRQPHRLMLDFRGFRVIAPLIEAHTAAATGTDTSVDDSSPAAAARLATTMRKRTSVPAVRSMSIAITRRQESSRSVADNQTTGPSGRRERSSSTVSEGSAGVNSETERRGSRGWSLDVGASLHADRVEEMSAESGDIPTVVVAQMDISRVLVRTSMQPGCQPSKEDTSKTVPLPVFPAVGRDDEGLETHTATGDRRLHSGDVVSPLGVGLKELPFFDGTRALMTGLRLRLFQISSVNLDDVSPATRADSTGDRTSPAPARKDSAGWFGAGGAVQVRDTNEWAYGFHVIWCAHVLERVNLVLCMFKSREPEYPNLPSNVVRVAVSPVHLAIGQRGVRTAAAFIKAWRGAVLPFAHMAAGQRTGNSPRQSAKEAASAREPPVRRGSSSQRKATAALVSVDSVSLTLMSGLGQDTGRGVDDESFELACVKMDRAVLTMTQTREIHSSPASSNRFEFKQFAVYKLGRSVITEFNLPHWRGPRMLGPDPASTPLLRFATFLSGTRLIPACAFAIRHATSPHESLDTVGAPGSLVGRSGDARDTLPTDPEVSVQAELGQLEADSELDFLLSMAAVGANLQHAFVRELSDGATSVANQRDAQPAAEATEGGQAGTNSGREMSVSLSMDGARARVSASGLPLLYVSIGGVSAFQRRTVAIGGADAGSEGELPQQTERELTLRHLTVIPLLVREPESSKWNSVQPNWSTVAHGALRFSVELMDVKLGDATQRQTVWLSLSPLVLQAEGTSLRPAHVDTPTTGRPTHARSVSAEVVRRLFVTTDQTTVEFSAQPPKTDQSVERLVSVDLGRVEAIVCPLCLYTVRLFGNRVEAAVSSAVAAARALLDADDAGSSDSAAAGAAESKGVEEDDDVVLPSVLRSVLRSSPSSPLLGRSRSHQSHGGSAAGERGGLESEAGDAVKDFDGVRMDAVTMATARLEHCLIRVFALRNREPLDAPPPVVIASDAFQLCTVKMWAATLKLRNTVHAARRHQPKWTGKDIDLRAMSIEVMDDTASRRRSGVSTVLAPVSGSAQATAQAKRKRRGTAQRSSLSAAGRRASALASSAERRQHGHRGSLRPRAATVAATARSPTSAAGFPVDAPAQDAISSGGHVDHRRISLRRSSATSTGEDATPMISFSMTDAPSLPPTMKVAFSTGAQADREAAGEHTTRGPLRQDKGIYLKHAPKYEIVVTSSVYTHTNRFMQESLLTVNTVMAIIDRRDAWNASSRVSAASAEILDVSLSRVVLYMPEHSGSREIVAVRIKAAKVVSNLLEKDTVLAAVPRDDGPPASRATESKAQPPGDDVPPSGDAFDPLLDSSVPSGHKGGSHDRHAVAELRARLELGIDSSQPLLYKQFVVHLAGVEARLARFGSGGNVAESKNRVVAAPEFRVQYEEPFSRAFAMAAQQQMLAQVVAPQGFLMELTELQLDRMKAIMLTNLDEMSPLVLAPAKLLGRRLMRYSMDARQSVAVRVVNEAHEALAEESRKPIPDFDGVRTIGDKITGGVDAERDAPSPHDGATFSGGAAAAVPRIGKRAVLPRVDEGEEPGDDDATPNLDDGGVGGGIGAFAARPSPIVDAASGSSEVSLRDRDDSAIPARTIQSLSPSRGLPRAAQSAARASAIQTAEVGAANVEDADAANRPTNDSRVSALTVRTEEDIESTLDAAVDNLLRLAAIELPPPTADADGASTTEPPKQKRPKRHRRSSSRGSDDGTTGSDRRASRHHDSGTEDARLRHEIAELRSQLESAAVDLKNVAAAVDSARAAVVQSANDAGEQARILADNNALLVSMLQSAQEANVQRARRFGREAGQKLERGKRSDRLARAITAPGPAEQQRARVRTGTLGERGASSAVAGETDDGSSVYERALAAALAPISPPPHRHAEVARNVDD